MEQELLERVRRIEDHVLEVKTHTASTAEWRLHVDTRLRSVEASIDGVKTWKSRMIGMWMAVAAFGGVIFQVVVSFLKEQI